MGSGVLVALLPTLLVSALVAAVWIPLVSFKAIRLGAVRYQYCPVGRHWTIVTPVDPGDLSPEERLEARRNADSGVP